VVGSSEYDAFGTTRAATGIQYRLGYTGEQLDAETGFVHLRARYYDPAQGRFLTKDPFPGLMDQPAEPAQLLVWRQQSIELHRSHGAVFRSDHRWIR
jgi:RHS repeat-associated protein